MVSTLSRSTVLDLDPKRIAANSLTIALHVLAFMLLLAPMQAPPAPAAREIVTPFTFTPERKPPPVLPPPSQEKPKPHPVTTPVAIPTAIESVSDISLPIDEGLPPAIDNPPVATSFESSGPAFVQLQTDIAPAPPYPAMAIKRRLQGTVLLRVRVDASGQPLEVGIERSSGSRLLDEAAQKFIKARWHFVPATLGGAQVEAYALVPVNFSLTD
jgi:protein TonB